ncbi:hypothetical protein [Wenjunlia tyrosinilytica]|jgi:hypothetical protein|uniref:Uncharacterized protein n=1 Tax=Wenjunlia tyrosinilytica TaxID=1544741 RepID=A0A918DWQ1_9ACTN|nr:hypothetical protein [Wenjunlia tyrosinilytica]GGO87960.1 hypothetical protein GCM10012280_27650 [Wenjunlia tyrosinilytica]
MGSKKHPPMGEGPSRHEGKDQHGWSPDVGESGDDVKQSAHRSFHPDEYAGEPGKGRRVAKEEKSGTPDPGRSETRGGEEVRKEEGGGSRPTGRHGASRRPSGHMPGEEFTGVGEKKPPSSTPDEAKEDDDR